MRVILCESFYSGSHKQWADGYKAYSRHDVEILTIEGVGWREAMRNSAHEFASRIDSITEEAENSLILCSSLTNAKHLKQSFPNMPVALYMHENQLGYPGSKPANQYAKINLESIKAADLTVFNSEFHRRQIEDLWSTMGSDFSEVPSSKQVTVMPVGLDPSLWGIERTLSSPPLILFNQRWEQDKRPDLVLEALSQLVERGVAFDVALLGEHFPGRYDIPETLTPHIKYSGFVDRSSYLAVLAESDLVVSAAEHEYFGVAIAEAIALGSIPCLPNRLSYPELLPHSSRELLYEDDLAKHLEWVLTNLGDLSPTHAESLQSHVGQFDWRGVAEQYDSVLEELRQEYISP